MSQWSASQSQRTSRAPQPVRETARSAEPPMASGSLSVGGTAIIASLLWPDVAGESGIVPVTSLATDAEGATAFCGIGTDATPSALPVAELLNDCRPIGVGDVIDG